LNQIANDEPNNEVAQTINVVDPNSIFKSYTDDDIDKFIFENENENTRKKTLGHIKLLSKFPAEQGEPREIYTIPSTELDNILCKFLVGVRQKNCQEYEPSYLRGMLSSYERHLKRHRYGYSIIKDHEFSRTREVLKCKQKKLKTQGKGNLPKRADPISDNDIALLYEKGCLGTSTPKSLLSTMWFLNTLHFGIRGGGEEHRLLCWGDVTLQYDSNLNVEYLEYN